MSPTRLYTVSVHKDIAHARSRHPSHTICSRHTGVKSVSEKRVSVVCGGLSAYIIYLLWTGQSRSLTDLGALPDPTESPTKGGESGCQVS
jgi:hypothetical protein